MKTQNKGYQEHEVVGQLRQKNDLRIINKDIQVLKGPTSKGDVGNKSKGKIDFLTKYCGYRLIPVNKFD